MSRWLTALDRAQSAVPMLLLSGMAAFSWWLVQSAPKVGKASPASQASTSPDYELQQARVERYSAQGQLMAIVDGQQMRHFVQGDRLEIDAVRLSARDAKGQQVQAVARQGLALGSSDTVVLQGGARVVATPASGVAARGRVASPFPLVFEGEEMSVNTRDRVVSADSPIKLTHEQGQLHAGSLRHDAQSGVTVLGHRVQGRYDAPARP